MTIASRIAVEEHELARLLTMSRETIDNLLHDLDAAETTAQWLARQLRDQQQRCEQGGFSPDEKKWLAIWAVTDKETW